MAAPTADVPAVAAANESADASLARLVPILRAIVAIRDAADAPEMDERLIQSRIQDLASQENALVIRIKEYEKSIKKLEKPIINLHISSKGADDSSALISARQQQKFHDERELESIRLLRQEQEAAQVMSQARSDELRERCLDFANIISELNVSPLTSKVHDAAEREYVWLKECLLQVQVAQDDFQRHVVALKHLNAALVAVHERVVG
ncbi:hypothetical protein HK405_000801, partial [Cladochytrium tenue]